jgi:hypothetical protein
VFASCLKPEPAAGNEVGHRPRDEHLAWSSERRHSRSNVYGDAADIVSAPLDLAGMYASPNLDPDGADVLDDGLGAAYGATRAVERGEDAVAGVLHEPPAVPFEFSREHAVVIAQWARSEFKGRANIDDAEVVVIRLRATPFGAAGKSASPRKGAKANDPIRYPSSRHV